MPLAIRPDSHLELGDRVAIPQLGFGVSESRDAERAVSDALDVGYRSIDTAAVYDNERAVGRALRTSAIPRRELFVTSKIWAGHLGCSHVRDCAEQILDRLGLDHLDLLLVHWPEKDIQGLSHTWETMEQLQHHGLTRRIGVSNFLPKHLRQILAHCLIIPAINQIELHPHLQQRDMQALHNELGIVTEAWSPLGRGAVLEERTLRHIAQQLNATPAQVTLAWHLREGRVAIPKSDHRHRIAENFAAQQLELSSDDLAAIAKLEISEGAGRIGPIPDEPTAAPRGGQKEAS